MNSISIHTIFVLIVSKHDNIRRNKLFFVYVLGIPAKLVNMCRLNLADTKSLFKVDGEKSEPFITTKGFRQGDDPSCDLLNIWLKIIIRVANIDTTGMIYNKAPRTLGYVDDLDIITMDIRSLDRVFDNIVGAADDMVLQINISKTKYMFSTKNKSQSQLTCSLTLGSRKSEVVKEFIYLRIQITADNNISADIRRHITLASRYIYGLSKHLRSKMLSGQPN